MVDDQADAPGLPLWRAAERKRVEEGVGKAEWVAQMGIGRVTYDRLARQENPPIIRTVKRIADRVGMPVHEAMRLVGRDQEAAQALADQTLMRDLTVKDGAVNLDLIPPREIAAIWVHCAVGMLGDAPNYSETPVDMPQVSMEISPAGSVERYALIVQRVGKLTPHEARQQAEERAAAAEQEAARLQGVIDRHDEGIMPVCEGYMAERAQRAEAALADLNWLIAAGVHVTIGAVDHNGGADLRVALDLDDGPAWYGPLGESLANARAHCDAQEIGP